MWSEWLMVGSNISQYLFDPHNVVSNAFWVVLWRSDAPVNNFMDMNTTTVTINLRDAAESDYIAEYFEWHSDAIVEYTFSDTQITVIFKWRSHATRFLQFLMPQDEMPMPDLSHVGPTPPDAKKNPQKNWLAVLRDALLG
jgi:hypothetical protein